MDDRQTQFDHRSQKPSCKYRSTDLGSPSEKGDETEPAPMDCCAEAETCPLSSVEAGHTTVCIKQLTVQPDVIGPPPRDGPGRGAAHPTHQPPSQLICQVCNARVALSQELAEAILVEPLSQKPAKAMASALQPLTSVALGTTATVAEINLPPAQPPAADGDGPARRHEVELVRFAPLGDPVEIKVRGYNLTLRKNEAEQILVKRATASSVHHGWRVRRCNSPTRDQ